MTTPHRSPELARCIDPRRRGTRTVVHHDPARADPEASDASLRAALENERANADHLRDLSRQQAEVLGRPIVRVARAVDRRTRRYANAAGVRVPPGAPPRGAAGPRRRIGARPLPARRAAGRPRPCRARARRPADHDRPGVDHHGDRWPPPAPAPPRRHRPRARGRAQRPPGPRARGRRQPGGVEPPDHDDRRGHPRRRPGHGPVPVLPGADQRAARPELAVAPRRRARRRPPWPPHRCSSTPSGRSPRRPRSTCGCASSASTSSTTTAPGPTWSPARPARSPARPARPVDVASGSAACLVVDRSAFVEAGGLAPIEDLDAALVDLCGRLRAGGKQVLAVPSSVVVDHRPVATRRSLATPIDPTSDSWRAVVDRQGAALSQLARGDRLTEHLRLALTVAAPSARAAIPVGRLAPRSGDGPIAAPPGPQRAAPTSRPGERPRRPVLRRARRAPRQGRGRAHAGPAPRALDHQPPGVRRRRTSATPPTSCSSRPSATPSTSAPAPPRRSRCCSRPPTSAGSGPAPPTPATPTPSRSSP